MLRLRRVPRTYELLLRDMAVHYSQPKGFVGRNICYAVEFDGAYYGAIVGGSSTRHLPGRNEFFEDAAHWWYLDAVVNNIFYHVEPKEGRYPLRNFSQKVLSLFRSTIRRDWMLKYGDVVAGFETLVELPRTGEVYRRDGWTLVGGTKGYTCKRVAGQGTDSWTGKRVWDTENLRPKLVFCRGAE